MELTEILADLGINNTQVAGGELKVSSPSDGANLGQLRNTLLTASMAAVCLDRMRGKARCVAIPTP